MSRRNHSRRVRAPYGDHPGIGYADEPGARREGEMEDDRGDEWSMGGIRRVMSERPYASIMTGFGLGFGLGLLVTLLLSRDEDESLFERYAPEAIQDLPDRFQRARKHLASSVPQTFRQAGESFKHAGESIASLVPSSWRR